MTLGVEPPPAVGIVLAAHNGARERVRCGLELWLGECKEQGSFSDFL